MIVISDTSVITNLIQLNELSLLYHLFEKIIIPAKVYEELGKLPAQIDHIDKLGWIEVREISDTDLFNQLLESLDAGEAASIVLALELKADLLIIDEKRGRKIATDLGISITGLIGVLVEAKELGFIESVKPLLNKLIYEIGFRVNPKLYREILNKTNE